jgi:hypothetical protein
MMALARALFASGQLRANDAESEAFAAIKQLDLDVNHDDRVAGKRLVRVSRGVGPTDRSLKAHPMM